MANSFHPDHVVREFNSLMQKIGCFDEDLQSVAMEIAKWALPPPKPWALLEAAQEFAQFRPDRKHQTKTLIASLNESKIDGDGERYLLTEYPFFYAFKTLKSKSNVFYNVLMVHFTGCWSDCADFIDAKYYHDILAIRHTLIQAGRDSQLTFPESSSRKSVIEALISLRNNVDKTFPFPKIDQKIQTTLNILEHEEREIGKPQRKGSNAKRPGKKKSFNDYFKEGSSREVGSVEQVEKDDDFAEPSMRADEITTYQNVYWRASSTQKELVYRITDIQNGVARSNVPTTADMAACSFVTYHDFLIFALDNDTKGVFALVWFAGIVGLDVDRPLRICKNLAEKPNGAEVLVTPTHVSYHIIRRSLGRDSDDFESAGIMYLSVPKEVSQGLIEFKSQPGNPRASHQINKLGAEFARDKQGRIPTARRLIASSRRYFAPLGLSELDYAAVSGRVPVQLIAKSHYYPKNVGVVNHRFWKTCCKAGKKWEAFKKFPQKIPENRQEKYVLAEPVAGAREIKKLLEILSDKYSANLQHLKERNGLEYLLDTVMLHQVAVYVLQEYGAGLRPMGEVGQLSIQPTLGALSYDKASRVFSERSYSPISERHISVACIAKKNQQAVLAALSNSDIKLDVKPEIGDLACHYKITRGRVVCSRMTGRDARKFILHEVLGSTHLSKHNWIRHAFVASISEELPAWVTDEILGHRRVGREPFQKFSTAGSKNFEHGRAVLQKLHTDVIPKKLLVPVSDVNRFWQLQ